MQVVDRSDRRWLQLPLLLCVLQVSAAPLTPADYRAAARLQAGDDLGSYSDRMCSPVDPSNPALRSVIPPTRVFDNLIFLGNGRRNSWALLTSQGIVLFDAMANDQEAQHYIVDGLAELGFDPRQIRMVVIMHGHEDNFGGARYLQEKFGVPVLASADDWKLIGTVELSPAYGGRRPLRDRILRDGGRLRLGDTAVRFYVTPGHTPGSLAALIPLRDGDRHHMAVHWGGAGIPGERKWIDAYLASLRRMRAIAARSHADVLISNHPLSDVTLARLPALAGRKAGEPHPFVLGETGYLRSLDILTNCARAAAAEHSR